MSDGSFQNPVPHLAIVEINTWCYHKPQTETISILHHAKPNSILYRTAAGLKKICYVSEYFPRFTNETPDFNNFGATCGQPAAKPSVDCPPAGRYESRSQDSPIRQNEIITTDSRQGYVHLATLLNTGDAFRNLTPGSGKPGECSCVSCWGGGQMGMAMNQEVSKKRTGP